MARPSTALGPLIAVALAASVAAQSAPTVHRLASTDWIFSARATDVDGDGTLDVVLQTAPGAGRRLVVYRGRNGGLADAPTDTVDVPADAAFWFVGPYAADGNAIAFLGPDGLVTRAITGDAIAAPTRVADVPVFPSFAHESICFPWRVTGDLDGDGRRDVVVPTADGYRVAYQREPGAFSLGPLLPCPRQSETLPAGVAGSRASLPWPTLADIDGDGRTDLMVVDGRRMRAFRGTATGLAVEAPIECELPLGRDDDGPLDLSRLTVADVDGDGTADLVHMVKRGEIGLFDSLRTRVALYLGPIHECKRPTQLLRVRGLSRRPRLADVDRDGDVDLLLTTLELDAFAAIRRILGDGIPARLTLHAFDAKRRRFDAPVEVCERSLSFDGLLGHGPVALAYRHGDFDGDGIADLLAIEGDGERTLVARRTDARGAVLFTVPDAGYSPDRIFIGDLTGEGRADVFTHDGRRVTIVLCR